MDIANVIKLIIFSTLVLTIFGCKSVSPKDQRLEKADNIIQASEKHNVNTVAELFGVNKPF